MWDCVIRFATPIDVIFTPITPWCIKSLAPLRLSCVTFIFYSKRAFQSKSNADSFFCSPCPVVTSFYFIQFLLSHKHQCETDDGCYDSLRSILCNTFFCCVIRLMVNGLSMTINCQRIDWYVSNDQNIDYYWLKQYSRLYSGLTSVSHIFFFTRSSTRTPLPSCRMLSVGARWGRNISVKVFILLLCVWGCMCGSTIDDGRPFHSQSNCINVLAACVDFNISKRISDSVLLRY